MLGVYLNRCLKIHTPSPCSLGAVRDKVKGMGEYQSKKQHVKVNLNARNCGGSCSICTSSCLCVINSPVQALDLLRMDDHDHHFSQWPC